MATRTLAALSIEQRVGVGAVQPHLFCMMGPSPAGSRYDITTPIPHDKGMAAKDFDSREEKQVPGTDLLIPSL